MRDSSSSWQKVLAQGFSCAAELLSFLKLPAEYGSSFAETSFKTRVPRSFAERMQKGDPFDPLLRQVLAVSKEEEDIHGYSHDPLQERESNPVKGLIHKYHGRVLLTLTGSCAVNCRYCFRRHFPYQENNPGRRGWQAAMSYIAANKSIHEVILSGGDPLLASDEVIGELLNQLNEIQHLQILRLHTRIPVVLPERLDSELPRLLQVSPLQKVMVIHSNHPQELDPSVAKACQQLKQAGCQLLNQSVLLAGVNDKAQTLADLSQRLFQLGVMPYYLHLLDKVRGAAHFDLPLSQALAIYRELQTLVPGYLLPRLAREEPGLKNKTLLI
ncbi:EF-P beta-lysylation protein EpmB [Legionella israelensis]|uniref:L-lysine 2,3-aminomutase n=1 Tax=Legionella israelensis TaxID=454 RepID=A0AAX1EJK4_9GAMM|nr:EF-P beta-lysylation protein EpmB [Legionella israelensis]QBR85222.1 EF-P beta-lysylation protein EpmB [Legionella israelensis]